MEKTYLKISAICDTPKKRKIFCMFFGGVIGLTAFLLIYGTYPLDVTNDGWLMREYVEYDICQHYSGWVLFRQSQWSFPIGIAENMAYPIGSSIAFTDSIPLVSIFFKLLNPILPETFQFFGIWNLFCFIMQGISAALLLGLFTEKKSLILAMTPFFVMSPILIERAFRHSALAAQWYIIFALYFYFKSRRENRLFSAEFLILTATVGGIHPYYLVMVFGLLMISIIEYGIKNKKIVKPFLVFSLNTIIAACVCFCIGIFSIGSGNFADNSSYHYGYFSMNLNALVNPTSKGGIDWSLFLPVLKQTNGNYDAFNYLGFGVILAIISIAIIYILKTKNKKSKLILFLKRYNWLILYCSGLTLFALTHNPTIGDKEIFNLPLAQVFVNFATIFRSGGRMFYPVYYLILLVVFVFIIRKVKIKQSVVLILCLLAVQITDLSPALVQKRNFFENYKSQVSVESSFETPFWEHITEDYDYVMFMNDPYGYTEFAVYAAKNEILTNMDPATRRDDERENEYVEEIKKELRSGEIRDNWIYVFKTEDEAHEYAKILGDEYTVVTYDIFNILISKENALKIS